MKNNFSRILWGVGLLAAAVLLVVSQLGLLSFKIGFWMIILTVIFVACLIKGLLDRSIYVSVFSIAFLVITYAGPLGIKKLLSAWMILFIALLVSIGLSLLFKRSVKPTITIQNHLIGVAAMGMQKQTPNQNIASAIKISLKMATTSLLIKK